MKIGLYTNDGVTLLGTAEVSDEKFQFPGNSVIWKGGYYLQQFVYGDQLDPVPFTRQRVTEVLPDDAVHAP
jgi:hypothetical protein